MRSPLPIADPDRVFTLQQVDETYTGRTFTYPKYQRAHEQIEPLVEGGGQERDLRSGTSNVAGAVGMGGAAPPGPAPAAGVRAATGPAAAGPPDRARHPTAERSVIPADSHDAAGGSLAHAEQSACQRALLEQSSRARVFRLLDVDELFDLRPTRLRCP